MLWKCSERNEWHGNAAQKWKPCSVNVSKFIWRWRRKKKGVLVRLCLRPASCVSSQSGKNANWEPHCIFHLYYLINPSGQALFTSGRRTATLTWPCLGSDACLFSLWVTPPQSVPRVVSICKFYLIYTFIIFAAKVTLLSVSYNDNKRIFVK